MVGSVVTPTRAMIRAPEERALPVEALEFSIDPEKKLRVGPGESPGGSVDSEPFSVDQMLLLVTHVHPERMRVSEEKSPEF